MTQKIRADLEITSSSTDRSGITTINMNSFTPDHIVGTTFKNIQVNENGEFVVGTPASFTVDGNLTYSTETWNAPVSPTAPATPPTSPEAWDAHRETYDDKILWWSYNGTSWVLESLEDRPSKVLRYDMTVTSDWQTSFILPQYFDVIFLRVNWEIYIKDESFSHSWSTITWINPFFSLQTIDTVSIFYNS